jgi:hypothetical protein
MTTTCNVLTSPIIVSEEDRKKLLNIYRNHLVMYNKALKILKENPDMSFKKLINIIRDEASKEPDNYALSCLSVEIHYLYMKYRRDVKSIKSIDDVQYLSFLYTNENKFKYLTIDRMDNTITINPNGIKLYCKEEIPSFKKGCKTFMNFGYKPREDSFTLTVFQNTD